MVDESGYELKDYKFFAFNGEVKALFIATDSAERQSSITMMQSTTIFHLFRDIQTLQNTSQNQNHSIR